LAEATHLRLADVDGQRAQIRIANAKGLKERVEPVRLCDSDVSECPPLCHPAALMVLHR
jgi:hypothetical protein